MIGEDWREAAKPVGSGRHPQQLAVKDDHWIKQIYHEHSYLCYYAS